MESFECTRLAPRCAQEDSEVGGAGTRARMRHRDKSEDEAHGQEDVVLRFASVLKKSVKKHSGRAQRGCRPYLRCVNLLVAPPSRRLSGGRLARLSRQDAGVTYFAPNARTRA